MQRQIRNYLAEGRFMEAMVMAKAAIKGLPEQLEFRLLLADVYAASGKKKLAVAALEELLALDPEFPGARAALDQLD